MSLLHRIKEEAIRLKTIMPRFLQLEVSKNCNLKCIGCYRKDNTSTASLKGDMNLSLVRVKEILKMIPTVKTVTFLGDGEPLMNKDLESIMEYLTMENIDIWLTTNGTLIDRDRIREWENYNIKELHISIDSVRKSLYEEIRVNASYEKVIYSLELAGESNIPTYINFLMYDETMQDLPGIIQLAKDTYCNGVNALFPIFLIGNDLEGNLTRVKDNTVNKLYIQEATELVKKYKLKWTGSIPKLSPFFRHCNFPFALPYITLNGDVYGCCYAVGAGRTEWYQGIPKKIKSSDYLMGNIHKTSFKDIWHGESYHQLRQAVKATEYTRDCTISTDKLLELRKQGSGRFSYCKSCLWRWGSAC